MNSRNYLELVKHNVKHSYKKLIIDQIVEHGIEHINHNQDDYLLDTAVQIGPIGLAAEMGSIFAWGSVATVLTDISSSVNIATAGLGYGWTWSQIPSILYGGFYDSYSFRDRDPQPLGRIPIRQKTIHELHHPASFSLKFEKESHTQTNNFFKSQIKSVSNLEFTQIYNVQKSNSESRIGYNNSSQDVEDLIKNNERVEQRKGHLKIFLQNAERFYNNKKFKEAIEAANKASKLNPDHPDPYLRRSLAKYYLGLEENNFSKKKLTEILKDIQQFFKLASQKNVHIKVTNYLRKKARRIFWKTNAKLDKLKSDELLAWLYTQNADTDNRNKNYSAVIERTNKAICLKTDYPEPYILRATAQFNLGLERNSFSNATLKEILQDANQFLQLAAPDHPLKEDAEFLQRQTKTQLCYQESRELYAQGNFQAALNVIHSIFNLIADARIPAELFALRGDCYNLLGRYSEALANYEQAAKRNPDKYTFFVNNNRDDLQFKSHLQASENLNDNQNYKDAITEATKAIQSNPHVAKAYLTRASAKYNFGQLEKKSFSEEESNNILQDCKQFLQLASQDDSLIVLAEFLQRQANAQLCYQKSHKLYAQGNFQAALNTINSVFSLLKAETSAAVYACRGDCYYSLQKFPEAFADYDKAVSLDPGGYSTPVNKRRNEYNQWVEKVAQEKADYDQKVAAYNQQIAVYNQQIAAARAEYERQKEADRRAQRIRNGLEGMRHWQQSSDAASNAMRQQMNLQFQQTCAMSAANFQQLSHSLNANITAASNAITEANNRYIAQAREPSWRNFNHLIHQANQEIARPGNPSTVGLFSKNNSTNSGPVRAEGWHTNSNVTNGNGGSGNSNELFIHICNTPTGQCP